MVEGVQHAGDIRVVAYQAIPVAPKGIDRLERRSDIGLAKQEVSRLNLVRQRNVAAHADGLESAQQMRQCRRLGVYGDVHRVESQNGVRSIVHCRREGVGYWMPNDRQNAGATANLGHFASRRTAPRRLARVFGFR